MTSILVVDDHPFFLHGFSQYLENSCDFTVDTALSVDEAIAKLDTARPDLAMLDVTMHGGGGLRVLRHMRLHYPDIPAMFLTVHLDPEQTIEAMRLGVKGIALKDSDPEVIINGMNTILAGGKWFERGVTEPALQYSVDKPSRGIRSDDLLTKREMEIVELVCLGLRNRQIADRCALTEGTVKIHLNSVFRKLGVASRAELIVKREGMRSGQN
ncbi:response regulator transcription factor [Sphingorhabdus sp. EL138]|jgi:two-component system nitrate/nitrite response regulator NarP|uniref:response regulator n=1 Tax=Sphingorhabdus sp. EL138 TaxID=2073156 RepID=UPI0025EC4ED1|nr:response regulator transcription factor [Sphingorhabdus sp. EL138]